MYIVEQFFESNFQKKSDVINYRVKERFICAFTQSPHHPDSGEIIGLDGDKDLRPLPRLFN